MWGYFINKLLFSHSVMIDSFRIHVSQRARIPCPSPSPRVCWNSCPLILWCCPTISCSLPAFSSCLQSFPASGSFPMSQFFTSGGQSIGASASGSVLSVNIQGWFTSGLTGVISLQLKGHSRVLSTALFKSINSLVSAFFMVELSHPYMATGKNIALTIQTFVDKVMSLIFNMLSRYSFSSKKQMSFNCMAAVTICSDFGAQENKVCHCFHCFPIYLPWSDGTECHDVHFFECWILSQLFTLLFQLHQEAL